MSKVFVCAFVAAILIAGASCGTPGLSGLPLCPFISDAFNSLSAEATQLLYPSMNNAVNAEGMTREGLAQAFASIFRSANFAQSALPAEDAPLLEGLVDVSRFDPSYTGVYAHPSEWILICLDSILEAAGLSFPPPPV